MATFAFSLKIFARLSFFACFDTLLQRIGSFPNLLNCPYPVVGDGLFLVELWETSGSAQRIELVFGVLEAVGTEVKAGPSSMQRRSPSASNTPLASRG